MTEKEISDKWIEEKGDLTHRLNYDLSENSLVLDIGGYKGDWANRIYEKYNCNIFIFEPIKRYFESIKERFKDNKKIQVCNYGFGKYGEHQIAVCTESSSVFKTSDEKEVVMFMDLSTLLNWMSPVDLAKINIEGCEYDVLESLEDPTKIRNIQVQFHDFVDNYAQRREKIREKLSLTHKLTYDFPFIWENWQLK